MMMAGKFQIGDVVPAPERAGIFRPGPSRWYALRVAPQREDQVEAWLHKRGVYAFHPVQMHRMVRFAKVLDYARRYLPGYVFARFPGTPEVHQVHRSPFILGALCGADGEWGILEPKRLRALHAMRRVEAERQNDVAARQARKRADARIRAGDGALFSAGPFQGFPCEVVELTADGGAIVRIEIFGRATDAFAKAGELTPLHKDG